MSAAPGGGRGWWWRVVARVAKVAAFVALVLVATVEGTFRYFQRRDAGQDIAYDGLACRPDRVCLLRPGNLTANAGDGSQYHFRVNAQGFRGPDFSLRPADPRTLRVAVFGGSMAFGLGVDDGDTFTDRLAEQLRAAFGDRPVEVLNFSLPMNYVLSNARTYRDYGRAYRPDAVVFTNLFLTNPKDVNYHALEIRDSWLATRLMAWDAGRWLVNRYQLLSMTRYDHAAEDARLTQIFGVLRDDQRARRMPVLFFDFFEVDAGPLPWAPPGLEYVRLGPGMRQSVYRAGPYAIGGDAHPTPAGHRYFAARVARTLAPMIRGERPPPDVD